MKPMSEQMQQVAARYEKATGKKFDQMTNAQHIRSMTDEELATTIHAVHLGWTDTWCDYHCKNQGDDGCDRCVLEWLKQPYEEDADD